MKIESVIQIDIATIRSLARPALVEEMQKVQETISRRAEQIKVESARLAEVEAAIRGLNAQGAGLAAKRNAANELADSLQNQMVDALSKGKDVEKLSDEYAKAVGAAAKHHGILAAVEKAMDKNRTEHEQLKASLRDLKAHELHANRMDSHYEYRLALAEFIRQAKDVFGLHVLNGVHERGHVFAGERWGEYALTDLKPAEANGLDKQWAELEAMDQQSVETVKAFITAATMEEDTQKPKAHQRTADATADGPVLGEGLPEAEVA